MKNISSKLVSPIRHQECNESFLDDAVDLFVGLRSGHVGKYIYEDDTPPELMGNEHDYLWQEVLSQNEETYYIPRADEALLTKALQSIHHYVPLETSIVDLGIGGSSAFHRHVKPFLKKLHSSHYIGIDLCRDYLDAIKALQPKLWGVKVSTFEMDFFEPSQKCVTHSPALGIMTSSTIGNIYGTINDKNVQSNLARSLKTLSGLTKDGWLLLSVDTNQDESSLMSGYTQPVLARLFLTVFRRIANELPVIGFDPSLFRYAPEWHAEQQLFAHVAESLENQAFSIGPYRLDVRKGQKLHLLNSYKYRAPFFEACCKQAGLSVLKAWDHEQRMKLYLLAGHPNAATPKRA